MSLSKFFKFFPWVKPSTVAFLEEAEKLPHFGWLEKLHGYIYGRFCYFYIGVGIGKHPLTKLAAPLVWLMDKLYPLHPEETTSSHFSWADSYHGKAVPLDEAVKLIQVNRNIELHNLEHVLPYNNAKDIVLQHPDHIAVLDCPCRALREHPCLPMDVCLIIGEPFASFIREHHPDKSRWITAEEAVEILKAEDKRGHVHHVFFKEAMLERFYAICNCCSCCCGAMQAQRNGIEMLCSSGFIAQINTEECVGCGMCEKHCQFHAIQIIEKKAVVDTAKCMGCGVCQGQCAKQAISLARADGKPEPLEIEKLLEQASSSSQHA
ncbi:4Fe-4S dicluster domain-containing protein [Desulfobaculum bizertense]|uniref:4Fe-4S binding domain-containing protein n=1 Tax=Desulfobaculum bizertense DSM 18034 TaxID=1121442 RepID=A0A1T4VJM0_9BACT|nr:4Fe-4S binding protein [Desulfobaculum bizertense]SKA65149.1 4Fe-4S binding domain-containing protein [Desulfobaculum bizertense DSM 18034]